MKDQILKYLRRVNARRTKAQIALEIGTSSGAVSGVVNDLVSDGALVVSGERKGIGRGRPATLYRLNR